MTHYKFAFLGGTVLCALAAAGLAGAAGELAPQTRKNLDTAMHGEAYANLKYRSYAEAARKAGNEELARLFEESADVEAKEHFAREADAAGLAGFEARNLADAMAGENYESTKMYIGFADEADRAGDKKVAKMFRQIAADEGDHYQQFTEAFLKLKSNPTASTNDKEKRGRHD
jgi:rubrerythrin